MLNIEALTTERFIGELGNAVLRDGIAIQRIADKFDVSDGRVSDWLDGIDLPPRTNQVAILTWLTGVRNEPHAYSS